MVYFFLTFFNFKFPPPLMLAVSIQNSCGSPPPACWFTSQSNYRSEKGRREHRRTTDRSRGDNNGDTGVNAEDNGDNNKIGGDTVVVDWRTRDWAANNRSKAATNIMNSSLPLVEPSSPSRDAAKSKFGRGQRLVYRCLCQLAVGNTMATVS